MGSLAEAISGRRRNPGPLTRSMSEEELYLNYNPIDELRRTVNTRQFTPEQQAENRSQAGWEVLSNIPGPGNAISAYDAYTGSQDAANAFGEGDYKGAAVSGGIAALSALGAGLGLPFGKWAKGAADAGKDALYAIPAWHGSPHDFDQFKLDKVGSGEGAQVYGHGLYFAENPVTAKTYQDKLTEFSSPSRFKAGDDLIEDESHAGRYAKMKYLYGDEQLSGEAEHLKSRIAHLERTALDERYPSTQRVASEELAKAQDQLSALEKVTSNPVSMSAGRLYRTELDVEPEDLLDWDKPLSQQSEKVRKAIAAINPNFADAPVEGSSLYRFLGDDATASQRLREAGIPGIRYLDQGSRGAGQGSSNFVIFDDALVKILGKE